MGAADKERPVVAVSAFLACPSVALGRAVSLRREGFVGRGEIKKVYLRRAPDPVRVAQGLDVRRKVAVALVV